MTMASKVALLELEADPQVAFNRALQLLEGIDDLNTKKRPVVIKVGIFDKAKGNYPTMKVVDAIVNSFGEAPRVYLAESDTYRGTATERLQVWKDLFNDRVVPFNLSEDNETREVEIADTKMRFSHILFKPNVLVSTHALRRYDKGTILKNLLGLIPDRKKAKFHKKLVKVLLDTYEAIGGIDLSVLDATRTYSGPGGTRSLDTNVLVVGRDAVAVETVGAVLVGLKPEKMPVIQEAINRGLGEGNLENIEILGTSIENVNRKFHGL